VKARATRAARLLVLPAALFLGAGCFQGQRTIKVNADGSGTIEDTLVLGEQMKGMMAMNQDQEDKAKQKAKLQKTAAAMGPGVTVVSDEKTPDGRLKTVYAFKDVSQIKVDVSPGPDTDDKKESGGDALTFRFARQGPKSVLTVVQPQPKKAEAGATAPAGMDQMAEGMWGMMKGMMKGLKLKTTVEVNGQLAKANSPHTQGASVTLLEMDFDQITADDANFKKFTKAGGEPGKMDPKLLQGVKGIKLSPEHEIVIEFTGK
jgi:hypothetical protein